ncbi:MAG: YMGG-like glycine zipper-containing protein [Gemmatimonadaceae bacterium]
MTNTVRTLLVAFTAAGAVACSGREPARLDESLRQDLSLASQAQPYASQQYVSPVELGYDAYGRPVYQPSQYRMPSYPAPVPVATRQAPRIRRAPAAASAGVYTSGTGTTEEVRNTKRDAILGAAAGAAIGVASSRDRLKGAVIGAAAGGVLGAIYGQKVDVNKIPR